MRRLAAALGAATVATLVLATGTALAGSGGSTGIAPLQPTVGTAAAFDKSPPLRDMEMIAPGGTAQPFSAPAKTDRSLVGPVANTRHKPDGALQSGLSPNAMPSPLFTFEGPRNEDNFNLFGIRVNPPDPNGDVGQHHYIASINLAFSIYTKTGTLLYGPADIGSLWQGFEIPGCAAHSGDEIVIYDEISNRWILTQFTPSTGTLFWNCVAVSTTGDPLGSYYRYAFSTGDFFPDYPKYGIMGDGLYITTREFGPTDTDYRIGVYAINRHQLVEGDPNPTVVSFYLVDGIDPLYLLGDGILPADLDGKRMPPPHSPEYFAGTMDDDYWLRSAVRRDQLVRGGHRLRASVELDLRADGATRDRAVRLELPLRTGRPRLPAAAGHRRIRRSTSTSSRTGRGRRSGSSIGTSRRTSRSSPTSPSRRRRASPESAGTRSGTRKTRSSTSRAHTLRATASTAGWAASRRTSSAISPRATASSTEPPSNRASVTPGAWRPTRSAN